jgi:hypothetical protein
MPADWIDASWPQIGCIRRPAISYSSVNWRAIDYLGDANLDGQNIAARSIARPAIFS